MRERSPLAVVLVLAPGLLLLGAGGVTWRFVLRADDAPRDEVPGLLEAPRPESPAPEDPHLVGRAGAGTDPPEVPAGALVRARGRVVDPDGRPIAGASIHALAPGPRLMQAMFSSRVVAVTDAAGTFEMRGERADDLLARAPGFLDRLVQRVASAVPVTIVLEPAPAVLIVHVISPSGEGIAGASVQAFVLDADLCYAMGRTDAGGDTRIPFALCGEAYVSAWAPGYLQLRRAPVPPANAAGERRLDVQLEPGFCIRGRVVDDGTGAGVAGAEIHSWEAFGAVARTTADGTFDYEATREVPWIRAEARGYLPAQATLSRDVEGNARADVRLKASPVRALTGVVLAADGAPVHHASVGCGTERTETDAAGVFRLDVPDVPGTPLTLCAHHPAHGLAFADARVGDEPTVRFPATRGAHGTVRYEDGAPAAEVGLVVKVGTGSASADALTLVLFLLHLGQELAVTDADGHFALPPLPPGDYMVYAAPRSALAGRGVGTAFTSGSEPASITLTLPRGIGIEGVVEDAESRPVPSARVQVTEPDPLQPGRSHSVSTTADAEGRFALGGLPEGRLGVSVQAAGYHPWVLTLTPDGAPLRIRLDAQPYVRLRITANPPPAGTEMMAHFLDAGGRDRGGGSAFYVNGEVRLQIWSEGATQVRLVWRDLRGGPIDLPGPDEDRVVDLPLHEVAEVAARPGVDPRPSDAAPAPAPVVHGFVHGRVSPLPAGGLGEALVLVGGQPSVEIRPDGSFALSVEPGAVTLRVGTPEFRGPPREVVVEAGVRVDTVLAPPEARGVIRGRVLDRGGRPVAGVGLTAIASSGPNRVGRLSRHVIRTADDGRFWFHYLTETRYRVASFDAADLGSVVPVEVEPGGPDLELRFVRDGLLRGRVSGDWTSRPKPFTVGIERVEGDPSRAWRSGVRVQPDGAGFYFERSLAPGRYRLLPPEGARWVRTPEDVEIREGAEAPPVELELAGLGG